MNADLEESALMRLAPMMLITNPGELFVTYLHGDVSWRRPAGLRQSVGALGISRTIPAQGCRLAGCLGRGAAWCARREERPLTIFRSAGSTNGSVHGAAGQ